MLTSTRGLIDPPLGEARKAGQPARTWLPTRPWWNAEARGAAVTRHSGGTFPQSRASGPASHRHSHGAYGSNGAGWYGSIAGTLEVSAAADSSRHDERTRLPAQKRSGPRDSGCAGRGRRLQTRRGGNFRRNSPGAPARLAEP